MGVHAFNVTDIVADLYLRIPTVDLEAELLMGDTAIGDFTPTWWQYDTNSSATDNYSVGNLATTTVIRPTAQGGNGRWLKRATLPSTAIIRAVLSQGTGIGYNSSTGVIANSAPDQTVVINGATGTYPNFTLPSSARTTSAQTLSLVGTGATGTQISSTKDSTVRFTVQTSATATIAGAATSTVTLKKCATNSATEGDWTTVAVSETSQSYSLAVALQGITGGKAQLVTDLPMGWFVKLVNTGSGTHSEVFLFGEKTIYG